MSGKQVTTVSDEGNHKRVLFNFITKGEGDNDGRCTNYQKAEKSLRRVCKDIKDFKWNRFHDSIIDAKNVEDEDTMELQIIYDAIAQLTEP